LHFDTPYLTASRDICQSTSEGFGWESGTSGFIIGQPETANRHQDMLTGQQHRCPARTAEFDFGLTPGSP
jgi:hypothetical protein